MGFGVLRCSYFLESIGSILRVSLNTFCLGLIKRKFLDGIIIIIIIMIIVGVGFVIPMCSEATEKRTSDDGTRTHDTADPRRTGQPPNQLHQTQTLRGLLFPAPSYGVPGPTLLIHLTAVTPDQLEAAFFKSLRHSKRQDECDSASSTLLIWNRK